MYILRLDLIYPVTATTVVCCILIPILCVVSPKKLKLLGDLVPQIPYQGSALTPLGDFRPGRGSAGRSPPEAEAFFVKLHITFELKYNKQQLLLLLDKINLAYKRHHF